MAYWLFKSEPNTFGWDDLVAKGKKGEEWDGVRNHLAKNQMQAMKKGELGFFYHSIDEKRVVGVAEVVVEAHPDSTDQTGRWYCVDIRAVAPMPEPVTLNDVKAEPKLAEMMLVKNSRLSVQPVTDAEWKLVCKMGGYDVGGGKAPAKKAAPKKAAAKPVEAKKAETKKVDARKPEAKRPEAKKSTTAKAAKTTAAKAADKKPASKKATAKKG